jgi:transcriptional regulator GlxA family with amidase domain
MDVSDWRVRQIVKVVSGDCRAHLDLTQLAGQYRISAKRLGALFRTETGIGFHDFVRTVRISRATELLGDTERAIKEIAFEVGYTQASNFDREFRVVRGVSPSEYRDSMRLPPRLTQTVKTQLAVR